MGSSRYSDADYSSRTSFRASHAIPTFKHDDDIKTGKAAASVHASLNPKGVKLRESRDSGDKEKFPIAVILDTTGSMAEVPKIIQKALPKLMGGFLNDKVSGQKYLGDNGYPDIIIGAVDDYNAMSGYRSPAGGGALQVGQFESGLEIDDNLTNLWLTGAGGGTYEESYDLAMYFLARHTVTDHWEKRHRKGYVFIIGDEHCYKNVSRDQVAAIIGDSLQEDIPVEAILKELQERYHVFFILPDMTNHFGDPKLERYWVGLLGQQNCIKLDVPEKICECIVGAVALREGHDMDELTEDGIADASIIKALAVVGSASEVAPASGRAGVARL